MDEILRYKKDGVLLTNPATIRRVKHHQAWYYLINDRLYRKSFSQPLHRCLTPHEAKRVLAEMHEGVCGEHIDGWIAFKVL